MGSQLKKISAVSMGNILNAVLGLVFLVTLARTLSIEDMGKYALLTTLLVGISKFTDFGTNSVYVAQSIKNAENIKDTFLSLRTLLLIITIPISLISLHLLKLYTTTLFIIFILGLTAYAINYTLFAFFQKTEKFHFAVGLNTIPAVVKCCAAVLLFFGVVTINLEQAFLIYAGSILFSMVFYFYLPRELRGFTFTLANVPAFFKTSAPAGISVIIYNSWSALANTAAKLAKAFTGAGIFSIADKIANIFTLVSLSVFTVLLPQSAHRKKENLKYNIKETLVISAGILLLALLAVIVAQFAFVLVFTEKYAASVGLLNILIFASAFTAIHMFVENFFFVEEKTGVILGITLTKLVLFLLSMVILVPIFSLYGVAYAQLLSAFAALLLTFGMFLKHTK